MNFFSELKRRNVYKVAIAYAVVGWLLIQVATQVFPFFDIPNWIIRLVVLLILVGFPIALVIAWAFELTPAGIRRTEAVGDAPAKAGGYTWLYPSAVRAVLSGGTGLVLAGGRGLRGGEERDEVSGEPFGWDREDPLDHGGVLGMAQGGVAEQRPDRGEPGVTGPDAHAAVGLQVGQERADQHRVQVGDVQLVRGFAGPFLGEREQ